MKLTIRPAAIADAETIAGFNYAIALETEYLKLNRSRLSRGVKALLRDRSKGFYVLAVVNGKVVGQLMITYEWSDWRCANFWWIQSVYIMKEFRGRGIFTKLYRYIKRKAKKNRMACGLRLYVERDNKRARRIYDRLGMKESDYAMYDLDFVVKRRLSPKD